MLKDREAPISDRRFHGVCMIVDRKRLISITEGARLVTDVRKIGEVRCCPEEPYAQEESAGYATAFLVSPRHVVTAGHAISEGLLGEIAFVFRFEHDEEGKVRSSFKTCAISYPSTIIARSFGATGDYCLVELKDPVPSSVAAPLTIYRGRALPVGATIGTVGHPHGLPRKAFFGHEVTIRQYLPNGQFLANITAVRGNSGSPVVEIQSGSVVGIFLGGAVDYAIDKRRNCFYYILHPFGDDYFERVQSIKPLGAIIDDLASDLVTQESKANDNWRTDSGKPCD